MLLRLSDYQLSPLQWPYLKMWLAIVKFPCDHCHDVTYKTLGQRLSQQVKYLPHKPDHLSLIPRTHVWSERHVCAHILCTCVPGLWCCYTCLLWVWYHCTCVPDMWCRCTCVPWVLCGCTLCLICDVPSHVFLVCYAAAHVCLICDVAVHVWLVFELMFMCVLYVIPLYRWACCMILLYMCSRHFLPLYNMTGVWCLCPWVLGVWCLCTCVSGVWCCCTCIHEVWCWCICMISG